MPNTFDEATEATREMFDSDEQLTLNDVPAPEVIQAAPEDAEQEPKEPIQDAPVSNTKSSEETLLDDATNTAEAAAQTAYNLNGQLEEANRVIATLQEQNKQLQGQYQQLQGTVDELSKQNQQKIVEEALMPPTLDINSLAFADDETQNAAMAKFAEDLSAYNRKQIMEELEPVARYVKDMQRDKEKQELIADLALLPQTRGIEAMVPQLDAIISKNKWLQSEDMPVSEKYINAYAIARGVNSINTPPAEPPAEPTASELMELFNNNKEFQELVEKQRLEQIKQSQQVPLFSASSGAVNAALNIKEKPQTLEEASKRTREMFGA